MFQDSFFETVDLPLADLFERAETSDGAPDYVEYTPLATLTRAQILASQHNGKCLKCGKPATAGMFCGSTCRGKWETARSTLSNRLAKTRLVGAIEQALFME
jgi:hypothetical protein